jgi:hypothetical protein
MCGVMKGFSNGYANAPSSYLMAITIRNSTTITAKYFYDGKITIDPIRRIVGHALEHSTARKASLFITPPLEQSQGTHTQMINLIALNPF